MSKTFSSNSMSKVYSFLPIEREQIQAYAEASGDRNPIHLDSNFAKKAGLPDVIAHGMLTMGMACLCLQKWGFNPKNILYYDGKFKEKVLVGDQLHAELLKQSEDPEKGTLELNWRLCNQNGVEVFSAQAKFKK